MKVQAIEKTGTTQLRLREIFILVDMVGLEL